MCQISFVSHWARLFPHIAGLLAAAGSATAQVSSKDCTQCYINPIPIGGLTIGWKPVDITAITVATATVIIDTEAGLTSTKTAPVATITADENGNQILGDEALEKFWSNQVTPAGALQELTVIDGTAVATVTRALVKGPGSETIVSGTIAWPTKYEHQGFAASSYLEDTCVIPGKVLQAETWALTPTITSPTYTNAFDYPINFKEWKELLPPNDCQVLQVAGTATGIVLTQARAVTDTVTSYGVVVNRQEATPKPSSGGAQDNYDDDDGDDGDDGDDNSDSAQSESDSSDNSEGADDAGSSSPSSSSGARGKDEASESSAPSSSGGTSSESARNWHDSGLFLSFSTIITTLSVILML